MNTINEREAYNEFEEVLNSLESEVDIIGYTFPAGTVLREMDPTAFREEMMTYFDDAGVEIV